MICISSSYLLSRMNNLSHNGTNPLPPAEYGKTPIPPPEPTEFIWAIIFYKISQSWLTDLASNVTKLDRNSTIPSRQLRLSSTNLLSIPHFNLRTLAAPYSGILCLLTLRIAPLCPFLKTNIKIFLNKCFWCVYLLRVNVTNENGTVSFFIVKRQHAKAGNFGSKW